MNTRSPGGFTAPRARPDGASAGPVGPVGPTAAPPSDPSQRLLAEAGRIRVRAVGRDLLLLRLGVVLMVAGPLLTVIGYGMSSQTSSAFIQTDATIVALIGLTVAVVGVGLFLRYSLGEFLRFWMARLVYEQRHGAAAPDPPARAPAPPRAPRPPSPENRPRPPGERMP